MWKILSGNSIWGSTGRGSRKSGCFLVLFYICLFYLCFCVTVYVWLLCFCVLVFVCSVFLFCFPGWAWPPNRRRPNPAEGYWKKLSVTRTFPKQCRFVCGPSVGATIAARGSPKLYISTTSKASKAARLTKCWVLHRLSKQGAFLTFFGAFLLGGGGAFYLLYKYISFFLRYLFYLLVLSLFCVFLCVFVLIKALQRQGAKVRIFPWPTDYLRHRRFQGPDNMLCTLRYREHNKYIRTKRLEHMSLDQIKSGFLGAKSVKSLLICKSLSYFTRQQMI